MQEICGVFATLDAVERACRELQRHGIAPEQLTLSVAETCPACVQAETVLARENDARLGIGRGIGALVGAGLGILALLWANEPSVGLFGWGLRLFVLTSWILSGSLLGGVLAVTLDGAREALRRTRHGEAAVHAHATLEVAVAPEAAEDVRAVLTRRGGRLLEEAPACVHG